MPVPQRWGCGCRGVGVGQRQGRRQRRFEGRGPALSPGLSPGLSSRLSSGLCPSLSFVHLALRRERVRRREGPAPLPAGQRQDWIAGWRIGLILTILARALAQTTGNCRLGDCRRESAPGRNLLLIRIHRFTFGWKRSGRGDFIRFNEGKGGLAGTLENSIRAATFPFWRI